MEKELWAAEYSFSQKVFHHDTLERVLELNRRNILDGKKNDYLIFAIGDEEKTAKAIDFMRAKMKSPLNKS